MHPGKPALKDAEAGTVTAEASLGSAAGPCCTCFHLNLKSPQSLGVALLVEGLPIVLKPVPWEARQEDQKCKVILSWVSNLRPVRAKRDPAMKGKASGVCSGSRRA